jgi:predicted dehydrogenase
MNLALLGADEQALAVARAACRAGHALVWYWVPDRQAAAVAALAPGAVRAEAWEGVLAGAAVDAVILARDADAEQTIERFRRLVQEGLPVVASHPLVDEALVAAELDMVRREFGAPVVPAVADRQHAASRTLQGWIAAADDSPLGRVEQLEMERSAAARDRAEVLAHLARDLDLLVALAGEPVRVTASAPREGEGRYAGLAVAVETASGLLIRWNYQPSSQGGARLVARGQTGQATLHAPAAKTLDEPKAWRLELATDVRPAWELEPWDAAGEVVANLQEALEGRAAGEPPSPSWQDACQTLDVVAAAERSLARGRTVELHGEAVGEEASFKGVMSSLGCLLLLGTLAVLVVAAVAKRLGVPGIDWLIYGLVGLLGLFLLLQLLLLVIPKQKGE